jgi:hypothetical protein
VPDEQSLRNAKTSLIVASADPSYMWSEVVSIVAADTGVRDSLAGEGLTMQELANVGVWVELPVVDTRSFFVELPAEAWDMYEWVSHIVIVFVCVAFVAVMMWNEATSPSRPIKLPYVREVATRERYESRKKWLTRLWDIADAASFLYFADAVQSVAAPEYKGIIVAAGFFVAAVGAVIVVASSVKNGMLSYTESRSNYMYACIFYDAVQGCLWALCETYWPVLKDQDLDDDIPPFATVVAMATSFVDAVLIKGMPFLQALFKEMFEMYDEGDLGSSTRVKRQDTPYLEPATAVAALDEAPSDHVDADPRIIGRPSKESVPESVPSTAPSDGEVDTPPTAAEALGPAPPHPFEEPAAPPPTALEADARTPAEELVPEPVPSTAPSEHDDAPLGPAPPDPFDHGDADARMPSEESVLTAVAMPVR